MASERAWRELVMSSERALCVCCGRATAWEDLTPVRLVREGEGVVLSAACGACMLNVDGEISANKNGEKPRFVLVEFRSELWGVERRGNDERVERRGE